MKPATQSLVLITILVVFALSACATAPTSTLPAAIPTDAIPPIEIIGDQNISISQDAPYQFANPGPDTNWDSISMSTVRVNRDTRWTLDMQIDDLVEDTGDASTGIYIGTTLPDSGRRVLFLGYQSGRWRIGYSPSEAGGWLVWDTLTFPLGSSGNFTVSISSAGNELEIANDGRSVYSSSFPERIFPEDAEVGVAAQIGPQTTLNISHLGVEQSPLAVTAIMQLPLPVSTTAGETAYVIHVSPDGDDENSGSEESPLATIAQAQQVVRHLNSTMTGPILVIIHGGTYTLANPLEFTEMDSGQNGYQITYQAADGEIPILSGGMPVAGWQQSPNSPLWVATVPEAAQNFRQLYVNGVHATRATTEDTIVGLGYAPGDHSDRDGIIVSTDSFPALTNPADVELHWIYDWKDMRLKVADIQDNQDGTTTIWLLQPYYADALAMQAENYYWYPAYDVPFYVENALELVTQPGQWYYDQTSRTIYYYPREGEDMEVAQVTIPQYQTLLKIQGGGVGHEVHDIRFTNLTFSYTNWTLASEVGTYGIQAQYLLSGGSHSMTPAHIIISSVKNISLDANQFLHMGAAAIHLGNNTTHLDIIGNLFFDIADAAIVVGSWEDGYLENSLQVQPQDVMISNNLIDTAGSEYRGAAAINAYYVANITITHNEISDLPYTGISLGWGWTETTDSTTCHDNNVSYNLVTNFAQIARDAGGIYTLGQQPGTTVIGNVFRNMINDYACLYPDAGSAYIAFRDNVCDTAPYWLHVWTSATHDITINNTYSNVSARQNLGTSNLIEEPILVAGQEWPAEAAAILQQAGLEPDYYYLREWLSTLQP